VVVTFLGFYAFSPVGAPFPSPGSPRCRSFSGRSGCGDADANHAIALVFCNRSGISQSVTPSYSVAATVSITFTAAIPHSSSDTNAGQRLYLARRHRRRFKHADHGQRRCISAERVDDPVLGSAE
jgi:hypothetical protein